jgi:hypothetical protein
MTWDERQRPNSQALQDSSNDDTTANDAETPGLCLAAGTAFCLFWAILLATVSWAVLAPASSMASRSFNLRKCTFSLSAVLRFVIMDGQDDTQRHGGTT